MIVGVDVGNTAIKFARFSNDSNEIEIVSVPVTEPESVPEIVCRCQLMLNRSDAALHVRIASVNRAVTSRLVKSMRDAMDNRVHLHAITPSDIPMEIATDHPDRVGIDRIVGAFGAASCYPLPLVVVDAGTTVTVDLVDRDGTYRGGAIVPGLQMQTAALASGTDLLPMIDWQAPTSSPQRIPGTNTIDAMRLGILSSVVGGVERLVRLYDSPATIVFTGGDAVPIASAIDRGGKHLDPQLVCRTLLQIP